MSLFNKLAIFSILILLMAAFVAVPVMAHQMATNVGPHANADPTTAATPGTEHALVESITVSSMYLTPTATITATITFADGVAAIADDDATTTGDTPNEARHATLTTPATFEAANINIQYGTKQTDGTYMYANPATAANAPQILGAVIKTRTEGAGATGSGAVYTVTLGVPTAARDDGMYRISVFNAAELFGPADVNATFRMDTLKPTIMDVAVRPIGQNYANLQGEWAHPFEITVSLEDPLDEHTADEPTADSASGLKLSTLMFEADKTGELMFGSPRFIGGNQYVVQVTPVTATTAKPAATVKVTVKVMDMAGNEGRSTDPTDPTDAETAPEPLEVKVAQRAATGTGTGPGDTKKPTVMIEDAAGTGADADKVIFTFKFTEALATTGENAFTIADLDVSNAPDLVPANLTTTDNITYMLKIMPINDKFPVKVSFKSGAKIGDPTGNLMESGTMGLGATDTHTPPGVLGVEIDAPENLELGVLTFTFTFAEAPSAIPDDAGQFTVSDIRVSNGQPLVAANLTKQLKSDDTDAEVVYELDVVPIDPTQPVTVQLKARSVSNGGKKPDDSPRTGEDDMTKVGSVLIAGEISSTWAPPTPDGEAPTVIITKPATAGGDGSLAFIFTFSEAVTTFAANDLTVTNAPTVTDAMLSSTDNIVYTLTVTPTNATMPVMVTLNANSVTDAAGNAVMSKSATFTPSLDRTKPSFTYVTDPVDGSELTAGATVQFTLTATKTLGTGNNALLVTDVQGTANVASKTFYAVPNTMPQRYIVAVTPTDLTQPIVLTIPANSVMDTAATPNGNDEKVIKFTPKDETPPTVVITAIAATGDDAGKVVFTFTFSEPLQTSEPGAFTADDLTRGTGVRLATNPVKDTTNDKVYTVLVIPPTSGDTILTLKTGSVMDIATNALVGDQSHTYVPLVPPVVTPDPENPSMPGNIFRFSVPANSYVILVRNENPIGGTPGKSLKSRFAGIVDINNARVIPDAKIKEWSAMPDLAELFDRGAPGGGGALVLRKSVGDTAAPAVGTVGISEIMWAMDAGYIGQTKARDTQWIEIENLNATAKTVVIYAQTGAQMTDKDKLVTNTQAGDTIYGNPSSMVVDVMTNYFNGSNRGSAGWDVPGSNGSSRSGVNFVSMARKGTFDLASKDGDQFNKRYVKTAGSTKSADGRSPGSWQASTVRYDRDTTDKPASVTTAVPATFDYLGTPGRANTFSVSTHITAAGRTGIPSNDVTINEVGNLSGNDYDWIELKGAAGKNLRNYMISIVTSNSSDVPLVQFDANDDAKIADNGVFLLLRTDPAGKPSHPIAATGYLVGKSVEEQQPGTPNSPVRYKVFSGLNLPDDGKFVLILRKPDNGEGQRSGADGGKGVAETGSADLDKIVDVAGWDDNLAKSGYPNAVSSTQVWPLHNFRDIKGFTNNKFAVNTVHQRNHVGTNDGASGVGAKDNKNATTAFGDRGWTGVGYRRGVSDTAMHGGTPGYPNGALQGAGDPITTAVYISEIMYADSRNGTLPQWIEIRNPSNTAGADLNNWRLTIRNHVDRETHEDGLWEGELEASILLRDLKIKPNSSVLVTSRKGPRSQVHLADNEIFSLYPSHRSAFGMKNANSDVINPFGFRITLHANGHESDQTKWQPVDDVGNLATPDARGRTRNNERFDMPRWALPDAVDEAGNRSSIARRNNKVDGLLDGSMESAWVLSSMDDRTHDIDSVYYGHIGDMSTPGQTKGSPLPVRLSFFRPTLEDGKVVIRWTTESELDNAGFNVYRSESRNGEFKQVNEQLIAGKGTTAERSTYKWIDTSAKPGVVYYYQIEDVSFAGERQTLTTTKLKGLISAKDKLATTWGDLKNLR